ncbi:MAG: PAS domain S-box protein [Bacteroidales bacterium]|nr:PAS domain S-box protein [Bacteroidales bacterium]
MILHRKKINIIWGTTAFILLLVLGLSLYTIRTSRTKQIANRNQQAASLIATKVSQYQEGVENIIFDYLYHKQAKNAKPVLNPFIRILSYQGDAISTNLQNAQVFIVEQGQPTSPFASILRDSNTLWVKSSVCSEWGDLEYAYQLDRLTNHINSNGNTQFAIALNNGKDNEVIYGLTDSLQSLRNKGSRFPSIISHKAGTYSVAQRNTIQATDNTPQGWCATITDVTDIAQAYHIITLLTIIMGIVALGAILIFALLHRKKNAAHADIVSPQEHQINEAIDAKLRNSEVKQIFNATANGIRIINTNFDILTVNKSFTRISGLENDLLVGQKCYTVFHGIYCHTANCPLERIRNGETHVESNEFRFKKDGKKIRCSYIATPLYNSEKELIGIIEDFKDISERHAVEETLKQTERQFEVFMDSLPLGVFIEDGITHEILYQNTYLQSITGNKSIKEFLPAVEEEKSYLESEEENQIIDNGGVWRYFNTHKFKFLGVNNQLKIGGVMIDITKKKEVEHYRDVLSKALENSPVSVAILSPDTEIEFINPSFARLTGLSIDEIYSKEILSLNLEYGNGNNLQNAVNSIQTGNIWQGEIQFRNKNFEHFWVSASFTPIVKNGVTQHAVAIMENITNRKEYEKQLLFAKSRAEESDRLKTAFLSNLSHEIRTPLNAIIGFSSLLSDGDLSFGERRNISEIIFRNSNDLLRLIENLIEISEIETGQLIVKKKEFSVNAMMNDLYQQLMDEDRKIANVRLSVKKEVQGDDLVILSDQTRIQQVLFQLLSNACKFTENGFIEFGYSIKDESTLLFYVVDSGIGIEPEKQSLLFNPFRQADDSNTRKYSGMGLGLAISKHIIEKLGGKIWLNSVPNSGTSVYFNIPFIPMNSKFETDSQAFAKTEYKWVNKTILVADDVDANFVFLKAALKKTDANVIWARNGAEAVDIVQQGSDINLILMDIVMPEMDGYEATRQIKNINEKIPVIGQTAYPNPRNRNNQSNSVFDLMLEKPIKINRMLMELDRYLSN